MPEQAIELKLAEGYEYIGFPYIVRDEERASLKVFAIRQKLVTGDRMGTEVGVLDEQGESVYNRVIWERGKQLPVRPLYNLRRGIALRRAATKAAALAFGELGAENDIFISYITSARAPED